MGEKDISEKILLSYSDVFADIVNALLFKGEQHWTAPVWLHEAVDIPECLRPYVSDIKINVFEIAYLTDEQLSCFHSDFRIVADYFVQMQRNGIYEGSVENLQHVEAVLHLLSIMTKDTRFEEVLYREDGSKGGISNMKSGLDKVEERGIAIGEARGVAIGEARGVAKGENKVASLMDRLFSLDRFEDAQRAAKDEDYRNLLFKEFKIF